MADSGLSKLCSLGKALAKSRRQWKPPELGMPCSCCPRSPRNPQTDRFRRASTGRYRPHAEAKLAPVRMIHASAHPLHARRLDSAPLFSLCNTRPCSLSVIPIGHTSSCADSPLFSIKRPSLLRTEYGSPRPRRRPCYPAPPRSGAAGCTLPSARCGKALLS